jgi:hypothetical protein
MIQKFALEIKADTGLAHRPVQYDRIARAAGNAHNKFIFVFSSLKSF